MFSHGEQVIHHQYIPGGVNEDGFKTKAAYTEVPVDNVGVDTDYSSEVEAGTTARATVDLLLFLPPGYRCDSKDRFTVRGKLYEVVGIGEKLPNFFTGSMFHTEVRVKRYNG